MEGCPWSFEKNILVLNEVKENEHPQGVDLNWCPFHVHVHDLPIRKITRDIAAYIGNQMGIFLNVEHMDDHRNWSSTLRLRVKLNVNKPLRYDENFVDPGDNTPYDSWLRAAPSFHTPAKHDPKANFGKDSTEPNHSFFATRFGKKSTAQQPKRGLSIFEPHPARKIMP
ncbi:hypothetical protein Salat_1890100 [Sesamum alatum]|uniref:DUF4283 domain-containing protein n=1 Tax=Sesamum alatum TaxID=300844 RepID=A0AAE1Y3Q5_9LAMI|nr:hypothetical protein Salat_1890100 [Sesamum alatum]